MSAETHGHTERGVIERATEVIERARNSAFGHGYRYREFSEHIAEALADAGLLLSDVDRAVLDAADQWEAVNDDPPFPGAQFVVEEELAAAVRARRDASS